MKRFATVFLALFLVALSATGQDVGVSPYLGPEYSAIVRADDSLADLDVLLQKLEILLELDRTHEAKSLLEKLEDRFAQTNHLPCAQASMSYGSKLVETARVTEQLADWKAVEHHFTAFLKDYHYGDLLPERVEATAFLADALYRKPILERDRAFLLYLEAATFLDPDSKDAAEYVDPLDPDDGVEQIGREERRVKVTLSLSMELAERLNKLESPGVASWAMDQAGILSYLSSANAPTSPFGQDAALGVLPDELKYFGDLGLTVWKPHTQQDEDDRHRRMLNAAARARYLLSLEAVADFDRAVQSFPEFEGESETPPEADRWWRKEQGPEKIEAMEKWAEDRRRLARWGYYDKSKSIREQVREVMQEERIEQLDIQFNYWSLHGLKPWIEHTWNRLEDATSLLAWTAMAHVPEWSMKAASQYGRMHNTFMDALESAPPPPSFKGDPELLEIYRKEMRNK